jgi:DNA-binding SARP family transcriptional activator
MPCPDGGGIEMANWIQMLTGPPDGPETAVLHLFGGPYITVDRRRMEVPEGSKRLLAFVALHDRRVERRHAAGTLWPGGDDLRAAGNLRSALWRLKRACVPLIVADKCSLSLRDDLLVDLHVVNEWARRLINGSEASSDLVVLPWGLDSLDLLPGWYDDWALMEGERVRQRLLHALEALSVAFLRSGRCGEAIEAAMLAVSSEPLRESAQRVLIEAHIAEGNWVEGRRHFDAYRHLLFRELGIEPHSLLSDLMGRNGDLESTPSSLQQKRGRSDDGVVRATTLSHTQNSRRAPPMAIRRPNSA